MNKIFYLGILCTSLLISSCNLQKKNSSSSVDSSLTSDSLNIALNPTYAQGFKVTGINGVYLLDIHDPQKNDGEYYHFALIPKGTKKVNVPDNYTIIDIPVQRVVCMTSLQLSNFIKLEETEHVVGVTSTRHLFNTNMQQQIKAGHTSRIGIEGNFNNEMVMALNPDVILISPYKRGGYDALKDVHIPLLPHLGYKEMTPLAQAEWIKLMGLLLGEEQKANLIFNQIADKYNELKMLAKNVSSRPIVFSGELHGGNWYAVGGKSFLAQLFQDAGADYFLKDNPESGGIILDFETVYSQANKADYWRILNSYDGQYSYQALQDSDERYADFKAFKEKKVIYCNLREKPYYEEMPTSPDLLLEDFVKAFHPELLPDYEPKFYELLK